MLLDCGIKQRLHGGAIRGVDFGKGRLAAELFDFGNAGLSALLTATSDDDRGTIRDLEAATAALLAGLEPYGARVLSCYRTDAGEMSEPLEFLSSIYNGEMRPVVLPAADTDLGQHLPYKRVSFGLDALETAGAGGRNFAAMLSIKEYPAETRPGLIDNVLRLPRGTPWEPDRPVSAIITSA